MKTQMTYPEFNARWIFIINQNKFSLSRKLFSSFYYSSLPLLEKLSILKTMPTNDYEMELAIEVLQANYLAHKANIRDKEWALFISNLPIEIRIKETIY